MPYTPMPPTPGQGQPWLEWGQALDQNIRQAVTDLTTGAGVIHTTSTTTRPTSDPDIIVIWHTPTPPETVMLPGDVWEPRL